MTQTATTALEILKPGKQWVCFTKNKVPYNPGNGDPAEADDPTTWADHELARKAWIANSGWYAGIGREFIKEQNITGIDLDKCVIDGQIEPWAQAIIDRINSYTELSPSGNGIHIWAYGSIPDSIGPDPKGIFKIEMYDQKRYFTWTGKHLDGTPLTLEHRQDEITSLHTEVRQARQQAKQSKRTTCEQATQGPDAPYGLKALQDECSNVALAHDGARNHQLNLSAFALGQLVGGGAISRSTVEHDLFFAAQRAGLSDNEIEKTMRSGLEAGIAEPRTPPVKEMPQYRAKNREAGDENSNGNGYHAGNESETPKEKEDTQALKLVKMALEQCELFSTPKGEFYARVKINGHIETMIISERAGAFKRWLVNRYLDETLNIPNATALSSAIGVLEAKAQWGEHGQREVYIRFAYHDGNLYLDLADKDHNVVKVTPNGWKIVQNAPVCFRRPDGILPLPKPVPGGSLDELKRFINVDDTDEDDWLLIKAWLLGAMHPTGPYPILDLNGERGSAKTSAAKRLRMVCDPHMAPLRKEPKDDQTFAIMAHNNYIVAFDNLSHISSRLSDLMCTLATGAGDAYRRHYSNDEEVIFNSRRPQVFTGIEELATRGDLIDRCIIIKLPIIEDEKRRDEHALDSAFEAAHPRILGALLDAVSLALRNLPQTRLDKLPRMADFALWVQAAEAKLVSKPGAFLEAYNRNREEGITSEIESSPVGEAIIKFMANTELWESTTQELFDQLETQVGEKVTKQRAWPKNARALSGALKRIAPSLRTRGLHIALKHTKKGSIVTIKGDANEQKVTQSDANANEVTQKNDDLRHPQTEDTRDFSPKVTQSDAIIYTSLLGLKEKKKKEEQEEVIKNNPENLRHFASPSKDEEEDEVIL